MDEVSANLDDNVTAKTNCYGNMSRRVGRTTVTVEDFSRLVSGIYAAAVTPQLWEPAIRSIQHTLGASHGGLLINDGASRSIVSATIAMEGGKSYMEYYHRLDYVLTTVETGPVGVVRTGSELTDPQSHREFHEDWARPYEGDDGLVVRLSGDPRPTCFVVGSLRRSEWFDTPERVKLMGSLVVHLQQALRTQERLGALRQCQDNFASVLDLIRHGVIVVGSGCRVSSLNSAAEAILTDGDGMHIRSGHLAATSPHAERELYRAVQRAVTEDGSSVRCADSFTWGRPSGKRHYVVQVLPLHRAGTDETLRQPMALILIIDPERDPEPPAPLLRRLYGLTSMEAQIALRIPQADLKQIAEELSISFATVRTHLQHVFDKTDTHRQAELVRLLLTLNQ
jgi:DNA-binding CsgD family transcriptional regulator